MRTRLSRLRGPESERGSISLWMAVAGIAMILLVGLAVDLGGQVYTQQRARDVAREAARAGGQQLRAPRAIRGQGAVADPAPAVAAADAFLSASDLVGTATVTGGDTVRVDTTATYHTKFLGIIGITNLTVTGHAESRITRSVGGVEQ